MPSESHENEEERPESPRRPDSRLVQPAEGWVELVAPSDFEPVERFKNFVAELSATSLTDEEKENLRQAIDEMAHNAIEWGNRRSPDKRISLSYCLFKDRLVIKVEDEGEGFDTDAMSDPSVDPVAHVMERLRAGKRPGGFGIHITRKLVDEVTFSERGNTVLLTKFLGTS